MDVNDARFGEGRVDRGWMRAGRLFLCVKSQLRRDKAVTNYFFILCNGSTLPCLY